MNVESSDSQISQLLLSFWALRWQKDAKIEKTKNKRNACLILFPSILQVLIGYLATAHMRQRFLRMR